MTRTSLAERLTRLEQQKNRLQQAESRIKTDERKARTRRLIEAGGQAFDREQKARDEGKEPLVLTLDGPQPGAVTTALRSLGFRWSKVMQHWEGMACYAEAKALADQHRGTLRRLGPPHHTRPDEDVAAAAE